MFRKVFQTYIDSYRGITKEVWLLATVMLINRAGTMVVPFLAIYLKSELGFTIERAGIVITCYGIGSVLGTFLGGQLTDRYGYYPVQFFSLMLTGWIFFILQFLESFAAWCAGVLILTIIADALRPANMASVAVFSKPEMRTRSISLIRLTINLGWTIGPAIGGFLIAIGGYKWLFWVDGTTCITAAIIFATLLPRKKMQQLHKSERESEANTQSVYRDYPFLLFILLTTVSAIAFFQLLSTMPLFFEQDLHMDERQIGTVMALNGGLIALLEMPIVYIFEKRFKLIRIVAAGTLMIGLSFLSFHLPGQIFVAVIGMLIITFGEIFTMPFANGYTMERSKPQNRGRYMALYGMAYSVALILAPFIGTQVAGSFGFGTMWYLMAAISFIAAFGFYFLEKNNTKRQAALDALGTASYKEEKLTGG